ncbi:MAG: hypothetical protein CVU52_07430, partial [Deltaproteobacteria bacterium HGW-Deltaproteobacteria-10]
MFRKLTVDSWEKINSLEDKLSEGGSSGWIFRGQTDESWQLSTNFEREAANYPRSNDAYWFRNREKYILQDFQRGANKYSNNLPEQDNYVEWLSLLQHYGGPTRFLDFTYSFYIALFFSMEKPFIKKTGGNSAIWAVNINKLMDHLSELPAYTSIKKTDGYDKRVEGYGKCAKDIFDARKSDDVVLLIDPYRQNERIAVQQGVFLFPGNIEKHFEFNMCSLFKLGFEKLSDENANRIELAEVKKDKFSEMSIIKIIVPDELRSDILFKLRNMNITSASLFPGLDGFARSLSFRFAE